MFYRSINLICQQELVRYNDTWDHNISKLKNRHLVLHNVLYAGCFGSNYKPSLRSNDTLGKQTVITLGWGKTDKTEQATTKNCWKAELDSSAFQPIILSNTSEVTVGIIIIIISIISVAGTTKQQL